MKKVLMLTALVLAVVLGVQAADTPLKSGPQTGEKVPGPFHPLNLTGDSAGEKSCLYCAMGPNPVAMIFAREVTPAVTQLIKKIDEANVQNIKKQMGSFVVFLSSSEDLPKQAKDMATKEKLQSIILSVDNPAGPSKYNVAKDAEVTVVLYNDFIVSSNHSFRKGELNEQAVTKVVSDISKIVK